MGLEEGKASHGLSFSLSEGVCRSTSGFEEEIPSQGVVGLVFGKRGADGSSGLFFLLCADWQQSWWSWQEWDARASSWKNQSPQSSVRSGRKVFLGSSVPEAWGLSVCSCCLESRTPLSQDLPTCLDWSEAGVGHQSPNSSPGLARFWFVFLTLTCK